MNGTQAAIAVDRLLNIHEISARTGHSPSSIYQLRFVGHELYSRAHKSGRQLVLEESAVNDWVQLHRADVIRRLVVRPQPSKGKGDKDQLPREPVGLATEDDWADVISGLDSVRHHSWCLEPACAGCLGKESWAE